MAYYLAIDTILITEGGVQRRFNRGEELVDVSEGVMEPLIRLQRVTAEPPPSRPIVPAEAEPHVENFATSADWRDATVESLDLPRNVQESLAEANLVTVADVLKYGAEHDGSIQSLNGIGVASERAVQEAIAKIAPKE